MDILFADRDTLADELRKAGDLAFSLGHIELHERLATLQARQSRLTLIEASKAFCELMDAMESRAC